MSLFGEVGAVVFGRNESKFLFLLTDLETLEATEGFASAIIPFGVFIYKCWAAESNFDSGYKLFKKSSCCFIEDCGAEVPSCCGITGTRSAWVETFSGRKP